jgi:hypothetical protein
VAPAGLIALYTFQEQGDQILDTSGAGEPMPLVIKGTGVRRVASGIEFDPAAVGDAVVPNVTTGRPATKVIAEIKKSNAFSVEIWARPARKVQGDPAQGPFRLFSLAMQNHARNFSILHGPPKCGQHGTGAYLQIRVRRPKPDDNGCPEMKMPAAPNVTGELQHIVYTFGADLSTRLFLDGKLAVEDRHDARPGDVWQDDFPLTLGNEAIGYDRGDPQRHWYGTIFTVAVYNRPLSDAEVGGLFEQGPDGR